MDLRNWEFFAGTSAAVSGANVSVYEASLTHPNPNSALASASTNGDGMWSFTGLSDTAKDVKVEYSSRVKWYKGLTLHSVYAVRENAEDTLVDQNLLANGGFEINTGAASFSPGTSDAAIVDNWLAHRGAGDVATITRVTSPVSANSQYALQAVYTKSAGNLLLTAVVPTPLVYALRGKTVSASAQVQQSVANGARVYIQDNVSTNVFSGQSATTGSMVTLAAQNAVISATATAIVVLVELSVTGTFQVDNVMFNLGTTALVFAPQRADYQSEGSVTIVEAAPTADTAPLATILNNLAERVKSIIGAGGNDWKDAIPASLTSLLANVNTRVLRAGDTMSGDLMVTRSGSAAPNEGRVTLGTNIGSVDVFSGLMRFFSVADTTKMISFDLASGALSLPANLILAALNTTTTGRIVGTAAASTAGYTMDVASSIWRLFNTADPTKILTFDLTTGATAINGNTVWHAGNDGAGSGLDADMVDGVHAATLLARSNHTGTQPAVTISDFASTVGGLAAASAATATTATNATQLGGVAASSYVRNDAAVTFSAGNRNWSGGAGFGITLLGDFTITGMKSRIATGHEGSQGLFHANETPTPMFEEYGRAQLLHGEAVVHIPEDFANYVDLSDYFVQITAEGPAALYVAERTDTDFVVRSFAGDSEASFTWHLIARQGDMTHIERNLPVGEAA